MDTTVFLGRQPIFDRRKMVFGYELLYRDNAQKNAYTHQDGDQASSRVINNSLNVLPLSQVVGERKAFVNITRRLLVEQTWSVLPAERTVVELLENVEMDEQILSACKALKEAGYLLALDDYQYSPAHRELLDYVDILKIDFMVAGAEQRKWYAEEFGGKRLMLLAEKVESHADHQQAFDLGYTYFQGYFFCKPEIVSGKDVPLSKVNCLRFIQEVQRPELDFNVLEEIIKHEVSLSAKLLRYLNSSAIGLRHRISSIRQAMALMGEKPLRKWASLAAMSVLAEDKPPELLVTCLVRARFCELLAPEMGLKGSELDTFLMGLFSGMDALLNRPLETVISELPVSDNVAAAMLGANTRLGKAYRLVMTFERGNGALVEIMARDLKLEVGRIAEVYSEAVRWADQGVCAAAA